MVLFKKDNNDFEILETPLPETKLCLLTVEYPLIVRNRISLS